MNSENRLSPIHIPWTSGTGRKAVFLDRDGVINQDTGYVGSWDKFVFTDGAIEAIALLRSHSYRIIIATNQSGIARGYYTQDAFSSLSVQMMDVLEASGAAVDAIYACPHHPSVSGDECDCRKPKPGMILQAAEEYGILLQESILVGDKSSDIAAAKQAGVAHTVLVSPTPSSADAIAAGADEIVTSLHAFARKLPLDGSLLKATSSMKSQP